MTDELTPTDRLHEKALDTMREVAIAVALSGFITLTIVSIAYFQRKWHCDECHATGCPIDHGGSK